MNHNPRVKKNSGAPFKHTWTLCSFQKFSLIESCTRIRLQGIIQTKIHSSLLEYLFLKFTTKTAGSHWYFWDITLQANLESRPEWHPRDTSSVVLEPGYSPIQFPCTGLQVSTILLQEASRVSDPPSGGFRCQRSSFRRLQVSAILLQEALVTYRFRIRI